MKSIQRIIRNVAPHWVGDGFPVRSLFSYGEGNAFDPFLLLDYAGPHTFAPSATHRGVGEHPHRGFETVTIVYQGEVAHRDSSGAQGTIGPGDVQWMTAASGVVHEEYHSPRFTREGGTLEMVQLWVNLPASVKMSAPRYQGLLAAEIPEVALDGEVGGVRVIAGEFLGTSGPAKTFTPINAWDARIDQPAQAELSLPEGHTALAVVQAGPAVLNGTSLAAGDLIAFDRAGTQVVLQTEGAARLLILTGEPIGEEVVGRGPFVMNSREEISQAIRDYQEGRMGRLGPA